MRREGCPSPLCVAVLVVVAVAVMAGAPFVFFLVILFTPWSRARVLATTRGVACSHDLSVCLLSHEKDLAISV
jgi:hypothetical protein